MKGGTACPAFRSRGQARASRPGARVVWGALAALWVKGGKPLHANHSELAHWHTEWEVAELRLLLMKHGKRASEAHAQGTLLVICPKPGLFVIKQTRDAVV